MPTCPNCKSKLALSGVLIVNINSARNLTCKNCHVKLKRTINRSRSFGEISLPTLGLTIGFFYFASRLKNSNYELSLFLFVAALFLFVFTLLRYFIKSSRFEVV